MFMNPGSRMQGRKGPRGKGDTTLVAVNFYGSTQTVTIPTGATKALVTILSAAQGGAFLGVCGAATVGTNGNVNVKTITGLIPGETLTVTIGAGGTVGTTLAAGGAGGTTSVASGSCIIATSSVAGASANTPTNMDYTAPYGYTPSLSPAGAAGQQGRVYIEWYS